MDRGLLTHLADAQATDSWIVPSRMAQAQATRALPDGLEQVVVGS